MACSTAQLASERQGISHQARILVASEESNQIHIHGGDENSVHNFNHTQDNMVLIHGIYTPLSANTYNGTHLLQNNWLLLNQK